jgi:hemerythrin-like domain-containing protein
MKAIRIIRDEHRALAAVLHGLAYLVRQIRDRGAAPDFAVLSAMIYYIDAFPERFHHPKEDRYLFALLRARYPDAAPLLDLLESEHKAGAAKMRTLEQVLIRYREGGAAEFAPFAAAVESYTQFEADHIRREEHELLPLAEAHLTEDDWSTVDAAFEGHTDPLLGAKPGESWELLYRRIVTITPPPIGVGPMPVDR